MNKQLIKALNKANNMPMTKENFLGLVIMLILSKEVLDQILMLVNLLTKPSKYLFELCCTVKNFDVR